MNSHDFTGPWVKPFLMSTLLLAAAMNFPVVAGKKLDGVSRKVDTWIGRDASELLMQLRVDGNRVHIVEDDERGETRYTWGTWNQAWNETITRGGNVVGMIQSGGGRAGPVSNTPILAPTSVEEVDHPATRRCTITFIADLEGIIRSWRWDGNQCRQDVKAPKVK